MYRSYANGLRHVWTSALVWEKTREQLIVRLHKTWTIIQPISHFSFCFVKRKPPMMRASGITSRAQWIYRSGGIPDSAMEQLGLTTWFKTTPSLDMVSWWNYIVTILGWMELGGLPFLSVEPWWLPFYSNLFPSGHYLI